MTIPQLTRKFNMSVMIEGIKFDIVDISQEMQQQQIQYFHSKPIYANNKIDIKIAAKTSTSNYALLENWISNLNNRSASYKQDIFIGSLKISGVYPINYTFNNNYIDVTFSADWISGDLKQAYLQFQRKEKLKKIEECHKYS